ncbi:tRNA pseudouridine(55) synthase TruB [Candidatus Peregrinibacteria bacterium]|nr:tRNA pseudouridine(55) synthase TruB [Candidatus Peregrinibacteria bacterium]MBI3816231.1 tRNA pseudouridine(55) synthase TruB [Candidatus Peregrinibacteria bacterium]
MRHGFLLIDKPIGFTSHDAVAVVRRNFHERSVGHLGTLDPLATGLLVCAVGKKALKVIELFADLRKEYIAEVTLGAVSTSNDRDGVIEQTPPKSGWVMPEQAAVQRLIHDRFLGTISQVPPAFSAVHVGGERAYRKARQGRGVNIPPRDVTIHSCDVLSYDFPLLRLRIDCGSGTYIRSLAHDLGHLLFCGGYLSALCRTKVGEWSLDDAVSLESATWTDILPLKDILAPFPRIDLMADDLDDVRCGRFLEREVEKNTFGWFEDLPVALLEPAGEGMAHARKVL